MNQTKMTRWMMSLVAVLGLVGFFENCSGFNSLAESGGTSLSSTSGVTSGSSSVQLSWAAPASGLQTGYKIEQSTDGTTFSTALVATGTATTATVTGLARSTTYYFRIRATNSVGVSGATTIVSAKVP